MNKKTAYFVLLGRTQHKHLNYSQYKQQGFVSPLIIVLGLVGLLVLLYATGILKVSGSIKVNKSETGAQTTSVPSTPQSPTQERAIPPTSKTELSETYANFDLNMAVKYPGNWIVDASQGTPTIFAPDLGATTAAKSPAGVILSSAPLKELKGTKFSTLTDLWKMQLKNQFPTATFGEDMDIRLGKYDAHVYNFMYPQKENFQARFYLLMDENRLYGLLATATEKKWPDYKQTFEAIAQSISLSPQQ